MQKRNTHSFNLLRITIMLILVFMTEGRLTAQSCPMRCIDNINLSISESTLQNPASPCETVIGPGTLLGLGALADLQACAAAGGTNIQTQIKRFGAWTPALGTANATVSGSDVGKKFEVRVVVYNAAGIVNSCWGTVDVEDKQAPRITCPDDIALFCSQLAPSATPDIAVTGDLGLDGKIPTAVGAVDGTAFDCTMLMAADQMYSDFVFETSCTTPFTRFTAPTSTQIENKGIDKTNAADLANRIVNTIDPNNAPIIIPNGGRSQIIKVIIRCWKATDHYGNASSPCYQVIYVRRATLQNIICPIDLTFSCDGAVTACGIAAAPADLSPAGLNGWPLVDINGDGIGDLVLDPTKPNSCNITITYEDDVTVPCKGSKKIFRTFTIRNWCTGETVICNQLIKVLDFNPPVVKADFISFESQASTICAIDQWNINSTRTVFNNDGAKEGSVYFDGSFIQCGAGIDNPGTLTQLTALADANRCGLFFTKFTITACDPFCTNDLVDVQVNTSKLTRKLVRTFVDAKGIINYVYEFSGFLSDDEGNGYEDITYVAADLCGYAKAKKTFRIRTFDNAKPQVVCITSHTASIGTDGSVRVYASTFNNGSTDNCGIQMMMVRRMDGKKCQANNDGCGTLVADTDCYRDYVEFGCCDVGTTVQVELIVIDQLGNYNSCMVTVTIQNKDVPVCIAPSPRTTPCTDLDLKLVDPVGYGFGTASAFSNCGYVLSEIAPVTNFEACYPAGKDFFTRTWQVKDCKGAVVSSCTQRITVDLISDFSVSFPGDVVLSCVGDIPSKDVLKAQMLNPAGGGNGAIYNRGCGIIGVEIKDDTLMATNGFECMKIFRRIKVIDWCVYNPNNVSSTEGIVQNTQIIKVIDMVAPVGNEVPDRVVCNVKTLCVGNYTETLSATDKCDDNDLRTTTAGLRYFWTMCGDVTKDPNANNIITQGTTPSIVVNGLALGTYTIKWSVRDLCGNTSILYTYTVTVKDCEAPTILTHDKNAELSYVVGNPARGMVQVCVAQVLNGVSDNCTGEAKLLANLRFQRASDPAVYPADGICLMFTCADLTGVNPVPVRAWTKDDAGLDNFVITYITVQDNKGACSVNPLASISGTLKTENNVAVSNVTLTAATNGTAVGNGSSNTTGEFAMTAPLDQNVQVKAVKIATEDKYAGVTTFDIARISKHLLDIEKLTSAYSIIAADVDKSGEVDATDMLLIRNFILRKSSSLPGGVWRFIDKAYAFSNPANPFGEDFPEVVNFTKIPAAATANFVAVKLGDVNTTYTASLTGVQVRGNNALTLQTEDMTLVAGNEYTVNITADNFNASAFQGTFSLNGATVKSVKAGDLANYNDGNFGVFANDITTSWNGISKLNAHVLSITFVANKAAKLSEVLSVGSGLTQAIANDANGNEMNVNLKFTSGKVSGGEFALYQNTPNPVSVETKIGFNLPTESSAKVTIYNMEGKVIMVKKGDYKAGYNEININKSDLNANGVLYYRLETPEHTATKKMIIIE